MAQPRTRRVTKVEARQYMGKAEEYLEAAQHALAVGGYSAAAGNAVHAGLSAADAILGTLIGKRSAAQSHAESVGLIKKAPGVGRPDVRNRVATDLQRLLKLKTPAEYDPAPVTKSRAEAAVEAASRITKAARTALAKRGA